MDVSVSNEFIKVYDYISKLEKDITDVAKEHYDTSIISYDEIDNTPENLSDFNNDLNFVTEQQVDDKIDSILFPEQDDSNFLKKSGEDEQLCNIPTKFDSLQTKTQNQEDSSENVATTEFVHNLVKEGNEQTKSWVFGTYGNKQDDKDFITEQQLQSTLTNYATKQNVEAVVEDAVDEAVLQLDIPTKTSQLLNDSGYITESDIPDDLVTSVNGQLGDVTIDIPTIPANVSAFNNDAGYITDPGVTSVNNLTGAVSVLENVLANWSATSGLAAILNKPALKRVATTGDYNDLDNLPTIPAALIQSDWNQINSAAIDYIKHKPDLSVFVQSSDLADVAVSGNYADLKDTPEIPHIPKNISFFTNDAGYITASSIPDVNNKYDKTGGNISGDVDIDGTLKLNIEDEDYDSAITMSAILDDNLGTVLTLTGNADSTQYKTLVRNVATPTNNYDAANKKYVDDNLLIPNYHLVELNADGSVHLKASSIVYSTISANLTNPREADYLDILWENGAGTNLFTRFYAKAVEITEVNNGDIKFIADVEHAGMLRRMVFTLNSNDVLTTTSITTSEIVSNKKNSVVNNLSNDYYASTNAIYNEFLRKPVTIWETTGAGLLSSDQDIKESMTWQLTGLDMTPYKRVKIYTKAGKKASGVGTDASNTPAVVLEMSLDSRAASPTGGHFLGSTVGQKPNDANRLFTVTCAISSDKTSFAVLRMSTLYGTAATANSDCNGYVFKIEGYYD